MTEKGLVKDGQLAVSVNLGEHGPILESFLAEYGHFLGSYTEQLDFSREVLNPVPTGPVLGAFIGPFISYAGLEPGRNYSLDILDPVSRQPRPLTVRVVEKTREMDVESGQTVDVYQLLVGVSGQESRLWVNKFGRTFRESGLGFTLTKTEDKTQATNEIEPFQPPRSLRLFLTEGPAREFLQHSVNKENKP